MRLSEFIPGRQITASQVPVYLQSQSTHYRSFRRRFYGSDNPISEDTIFIGQTIRNLMVCGRTRSRCDVPRLDVLNTANLCPAVSVVGLFYLLTVIMNFVYRFIFRLRFYQKVPVWHVCLVYGCNCFWCILDWNFRDTRGVYNGRLRGRSFS